MKLFKFLLYNLNLILNGLSFFGSVLLFILLLQVENEPIFTFLKIIDFVIAISLLSNFYYTVKQKKHSANNPTDTKLTPFDHSPLNQLGGFKNDIFKSSQPMICIFHSNGQFKESNSAWKAHTGLETESSLDQGWIQAIYNEDKELFLEHWNSFLSGNSGFYFKHRLMDKNKNIKWVLSSAVPYLEDIKLIVCDISDITEENILLNQLKDGLDLSTIIAITDEKGLITYANKAFCTISQYEEKELIGKSHRLINSATHDKNYFKTMWTTISAGQIWVGEICNKAKDGSLYWTHAVIIPFVNEAKKPFQYLALRFDITKRKKREILFQTTSELYQYYNNNTGIDIITRIMVEKTLTITRSSIGFLGIKKNNKVYIYNISQAYRNNENKKYEFLSVKEDFDVDDSETILGWVLSQDKPFIIKENGRFPFPFGGGINNIKINSFIGIPFQIGNNEIAYLGLVNSDIPYEIGTLEELEPLIQTFSQILTDIKTQDIKLELTNQIKQREDNLNIFISHLPTSIAMLDKNLKFVNFSDKWLKEYHIESPHIQNKSIYEVSPELPEKWKDYINKVLETNQPITCEESITSQAGSSDWIKWDIYPWIKENEVAGVVVQSCITTNEKDMQIEIEQLSHRQLLSSKMALLGNMTSEIAHEINNPLTIINSYSEKLRHLISVGQFSEDALIKVATNIEKTVDRIAFIVKGLKAFARDGDNDPFLPNSVNKIIEDTLPFAETKLQKHQILLKYEPFNENLALECRDIQLSQVILNLINNACDAIQNLENRWIELKVDEQESEITIKITDSGHGIPKEIREKIMYAFFTTKVEDGGTGLGLSISKSIIESHGGILYLDENSVNTCFVLRLPKSQNQPLVITNPSDALAIISAWKKIFTLRLQKESSNMLEFEQTSCPLCIWISSVESKYNRIQQFQDVVKSHENFLLECKKLYSEIDTHRDRTLQKIFLVNSSFNKSFKDLCNSLISFSSYVTKNEILIHNKAA